MLWRSKKAVAPKADRATPAFAQAAEATRRAAFLNTAASITADEAYRQQLRDLLLTCRSAALKAGQAEGRSQADVDTLIGELCDADAVRMKAASDEEFRAFVSESGELVKRFLATI